MSLLTAWKEKFQLSASCTLKEALKNQFIDEIEYQKWAGRYYGLPILEDEFFEKYSSDANFLDKIKKQNIANPSAIPCFEWNDILYVACLEPQELPTDQKTVFFITSLKSMEFLWQSMKPSVRETSPQAPLEELSLSIQKEDPIEKKPILQKIDNDDIELKHLSFLESMMFFIMDLSKAAINFIAPKNKYTKTDKNSQSMDLSNTHKNNKVKDQKTSIQKTPENSKTIISKTPQTSSPSADRESPPYLSEKRKKLLQRLWLWIQMIIISLKKQLKSLLPKRILLLQRLWLWIQMIIISLKKHLKSLLPKRILLLQCLWLWIQMIIISLKKHLKKPSSKEDSPPSMPLALDTDDNNQSQKTSQKKPSSKEDSPPSMPLALDTDDNNQSKKTSQKKPSSKEDSPPPTPLALDTDDNNQSQKTSQKKPSSKEDSPPPTPLALDTDDNNQSKKTSQKPSSKEDSPPSMPLALDTDDNNQSQKTSQKPSSKEDSPPSMPLALDTDDNNQSQKTSQKKPSSKEDSPSPTPLAEDHSKNTVLSTSSETHKKDQLENKTNPTNDTTGSFVILDQKKVVEKNQLNPIRKTLETTKKYVNYYVLFVFKKNSFIPYKWSANLQNQKKSSWYHTKTFYFSYCLYEQTTLFWAFSSCVG